MKKTSQLPTLQILLILLVGLTFIQTATAQQTDTLSVYFQFGEWKIQKSQVRRIEAIPRVIYTNDLDSVHYIGMADSVGSLMDNLKLGEKRAQEVSRAVSPFLQTKPPYRVYSMGEQRGDAGESRRVDVIFFSPELIPNDQVELPPSDTILRAPLCLKRADTLLHRSHIYSERERRRSYVTIETNYVNIVKDSLFYCARRLGTSARGDSIEIYPIKWQVGKTYGIGNKKQDKYCRVDKRDFDEFELFTVDTGNCRGCAFSEFEYARNRRASSEKCRMADRFLMNHLEVKQKRFRSGLVNVRVPKTYVIKNERYYL
ncbi:MAG: hypothetical protein KDC76_07545, partial [Bacteroidetes bacterium]|nr:hypothetical protein [Bacteroidota bacterium]